MRWNNNKYNKEHKFYINNQVTWEFEGLEGFGRGYVTQQKLNDKQTTMKLKKNNYKVIFIFLMNYVSSYRVLGVCYLVSPHLVFQLLLNYHYLLVSSHKVLMIALTPINNFSLWWIFLRISEGQTCILMWSNLTGLGINPTSQPSLTNRPIHQLLSYFSLMCKKSPMSKDTALPCTGESSSTLPS